MSKKEVSIEIHPRDATAWLNGNTAMINRDGAETATRALARYGSLSRITVWQHECEDGISPHLPAIWRQHSRSSSVSTVLGNRQAMSGDANSESASSETASLLTDFTPIQSIFSCMLTAIWHSSHHGKRAGGSGILDDISGQIFNVAKQTRCMGGSSVACGFQLLSHHLPFYIVVLGQDE